MSSIHVVRLLDSLALQHHDDWNNEGNFHWRNFLLEKSWDFDLQKQFYDQHKPELRVCVSAELRVCLWAIVLIQSNCFKNRHHIGPSGRTRNWFDNRLTLAEATLDSCLLTLDSCSCTPKKINLRPAWVWVACQSLFAMGWLSVRDGSVVCSRWVGCLFVGECFDEYNHLNIETQVVGGLTIASTLAWLLSLVCFSCSPLLLADLWYQYQKCMHTTSTPKLEYF